MTISNSVVFSFFKSRFIGQLPVFYFLAKAIMCQPVFRVMLLGMRLKTGTKKALKKIAFKPFCNLDFTGNLSGTISTESNLFKSALNSLIEYLFNTGASSCSNPTPSVCDRKLSQEIRLY